MQNEGSKLIKPIDLGNRNLLGLRPAQASLYKYLKKCSDEGTTVILDEVIKIYFYEVRNPYHPICPRCGPGSIFRDISNRNVLTMKNEPNYRYFVEQPTRQWMQHTIGSLVMRGLLTVIPNLETQITQDDQATD